MKEKTGGTRKKKKKKDIEELKESVYIPVVWRHDYSDVNDNHHLSLS